MIIINSVVRRDQIVVPTKFPDGTAQVWRLDLEDYIEKNASVKLIWYFEEEAELIHLLQLEKLLTHYDIVIDELYIPFLPYSRQDKLVSNETTFARCILTDILHSRFPYITSLDLHSYSTFINSYSPEQYIQKAIRESSPDCLVFPDKGAFERYGEMYPLYNTLVLDKVRDQLTGNITGLDINTELTDMNLDISNKVKFLIVDDLADGGATFIGASIFLHERFDCDVALYVTHGIFSKGFEKLIDSGISEFYTTQSRINMTDGYPLTEV